MYDNPGRWGNLQGLQKDEAAEAGVDLQATPPPKRRVNAAAPSAVWPLGGPGGSVWRRGPEQGSERGRKAAVWGRTGQAADPAFRPERPRTAFLLYTDNNANTACPFQCNYMTLQSFSRRPYPERRTMKCKSEPGTSELKTRAESTVPIP